MVHNSVLETLGLGEPGLFFPRADFQSFPPSMQTYVPPLSPITLFSVFLPDLAQALATGAPPDPRTLHLKDCYPTFVSFINELSFPLSAPLVHYVEASPPSSPIPDSILAFFSGASSVTLFFPHATFRRVVYRFLDLPFPV